MVTYRFYPRADAAQDKIWRYTFDKWGEAQVTGHHLHHGPSRVFETALQKAQALATAAPSAIPKRG